MTNNRKILIVSPSFYPMNTPRSHRTTELVKEFSNQGHEVTLITSKNGIDRRKFCSDYEVTIKYLPRRRLKEIQLNGRNKIVRLFKRMIRRILLQLFQYPNIELVFQVRNCLKTESNYDLLISIASPHAVHWGTAWARSEKNPIAKTWVADCGDPFMGTTTDSFKPLFYFKYFEKYWNRKCDFISIPFAGAMDAYYEDYRDKIVIIPQGFKFDEVCSNDVYSRAHNIPTFAYSGGFIQGARDPKEFISFLLKQDVRFKFIIYTKSLGMVKPFLSDSGDKIEIREYIPRKVLIRELSQMDFIVNFNNGNSTQLPSKLIDYYLSGRPILSLDSYNFDKKVVHEFLKGDYTNQLIIKNPDQYKIENVCIQFLSLSN